MRVPLSWLREFVDITISIDELADRLTMAGLEVAHIDFIGVPAPEGSIWGPDLSGPPPEAIPWDREKVFVGELLEVRPHPDADRLKLPVVRYGPGQDQVITMVTGAPNIEVGMTGKKVALALSGAKLIDGHSEERKWITLKPGKIRGVESAAMVCSKLELGLSDEHEGVIILPDDAPTGTPLADYLGEVVLEIELTPNLGRALSIIGVAREVAALTGAELRLPDPAVQTSGAPVEGRVAVEIDDPELCPRYVAGLIEGVKIGPSPEWMQRRLRLAGQRPVSNIVDVTNYVMLEWGQPLHAFDAARVQGQRIIVRAAQPGEEIETIDHQRRKLDELKRPPLLICDPSGPIAIAGVMGGAESEVSDATADIILESATFNPTSVGRTAKALRLPSEASKRFERGVDPELPPVVARRALELMRQVAGGTVAEGLVDVYPHPHPRRELHLPAREVGRLLGIDLDAESIAALLRPLGFACMVHPDAVEVAVPSFRLDVEIPADLVEEVARMYGYHNIPETLMADTLPAQRDNNRHASLERIRDLLARSGLDEALSYTFIALESVGDITASGTAPTPDQYLRVINPITPERQYLRQSLLPELLPALSTNLREQRRAALFEIGAVHMPVEGQLLPDEQWRLALVMGGPRTAPSWQSQDATPLDYFDLKGLVEVLIDRLGLTGKVGFAPESTDQRFHPGRTARLVVLERRGRDMVESRVLGVLGEVHPLVRERLGISAPRALAAELDLDALLELTADQRYKPISRMPAIYQDVALLAPIELPAARIAQALEQGGGQLLESVELFDIYEGPQVPAGQRSLAFRLGFRAPDKTLSDSEVTKLREKLVRKLSHELGVTVRA